MEPVLKVVNLTKKYPGVIALNNVNIMINRGEVVGLLGPNGSGKSTLMRITVGQSRPSSGEVYINKMAPGIKTRSMISFSPEDNHLYSWMTVREAVDFYEYFFPSFSRRKAEDMLEFMKISLTPYISRLSKGMIARLKLVLALCWKAELVLLDEPFSGIDPASREKIIEGILAVCSKEGKTIIISTHFVNEVEPILNSVIFLNNGEVFLQEEADRLREKYSCSIDQIFRRELS